MPPSNVASKLKNFAFGKGALAAAGGSPTIPIGGTPSAASSSSSSSSSKGSVTGKANLPIVQDAQAMANSKLMQEAVKRASSSKKR